jgi:hypothetical protein
MARQTKIKLLTRAAVLTLVILGSVRPSTLGAAAQDGFTPQEFKDLQFNNDERRFLELLSEQNKAFDHLITLFGLAQIATAPKTPTELVETLVNDAVTVKAPGWDAAAKGAKNIVAGKASQSVQLFILGKHPDLPSKKPQGKNLNFFKSLAAHYTSMLEP